MFGAARKAGSPPAQAATWSYNTRTFFDDFDSLSTIDINNSISATNTAAGQYKWFAQDHFALTSTAFVQTANTAQPAADDAVSQNTTVNSSVLTLRNVGQSANNFSISTTYLTATNVGGTPNSHIEGFLLKNGGYVEARLAFDESLSVGGSGYTNRRWPAFWLVSYPGTNQATRWMEVDILDGLPDIVGTMQINCYLHDWHPTYGDGYGNITQPLRSTVSLPAVGAMRTTDFATYGLLWVPAAKNSGVGHYKFYINDVLTNDIPYASDTSQAGAAYNPFPGGGTFYDADNHGDGYAIVLSGGNRGTTPGADDFPLLVDWVKVWQ